jgi:hypothetical protein
MNFTIEENEAIRNFLNGDDSYVPTSEILYLHSRPLLRPNFITQIQDLVDEVAVHVKNTGLKGQPITDLGICAIELGVELGKGLQEENLTKIAFTFRKIYKICKDLKPILKTNG